MSKIIAFAGLDGSGKTTQAKLLADRLEQGGNTVLLCNPMHHPKSLQKLKDVGELLKIDYEEFFGSEIVGIIHLTDVWNYINNLLKNANKYDYIICERYLLDFYVYSILLESNLEFQKCNIEALQEPFLYIFLDVPTSVSEKRINERDEIQCRKSVYQSSSKARKLFLQKIKNYKNYKIINTKNKSISEINNEIFISIKNTCK